MGVVWGSITCLVLHPLKNNPFENQFTIHTSRLRKRSAHNAVDRMCHITIYTRLLIFDVYVIAVSFLSEDTLFALSIISFHLQTDSATIFLYTYHIASDGIAANINSQIHARTC